MDIQFTFNITPLLLEQFIGSVVVILMLVTLAWAVRKFIGE